MKINQHITFLPTNNLVITTHFYRDIFELELFLDQGDCIIFQTCNNSFLGFCDRSELNQPGKIILTLITEDVDSFFISL